MNYMWIYNQFSGIDVNDKRLNDRVVRIAEAIALHPEKTLPGRFDDWADLKATYRFFDNPKVSHSILQQPHYYNVLEKARFSEELVLFIQDGSELLFNSHPWTHGLGPTADSTGNGLMFHSSLVAKLHDSKETEILGLSYQEAWIRPKEKTKNGPKESKVWLRTLEQSGPPRSNWVSVGDRGNDIYNFLHGANNLGWNYVVRARHDRKIDIDGRQTRLFSWIRDQTAQSTAKIFLRAKGKEFSGEVNLEMTWVKAKLLPPEKSRALPSEEVTYIRVWSPDRPNLEWLIVTNLPVESEEEALKIIEIYRCRWLIEDYHKALKTGCRIEDIQLKQASRILSAFGIIGVIATKFLALRERCRLSPTMPAEKAIPKRWILLVERRLNVTIRTVKDFWYSLARLGGFIGRKSDGRPGWQTIWGGYTKLQDMLLGADLI